MPTNPRLETIAALRFQDRAPQPRWYRPALVRRWIVIVVASPAPMRLLVGIIAVLGLTNCTFEKPPDVGDDDGGATDASTLDATSGCIPFTTVCDDDASLYVECSGTGTVEFELNCPLGCASDEEKCVDVDPSNGLAAQLDMARGGPDVAFAGSSTIDTLSGDVVNGGVPTKLPTAEFMGMRVYMLGRLEVSGTLKVSGFYPVVFLVDGDVEILGVLDVSGDVDVPGPGTVSSNACNGILVNEGAPSPGGGGGGRYDAGGVGGSAGDGTPGSSGAMLRDDDLVPLRGGCGGSGVRETAANSSAGGAGGGAVQIVSRTRIAITGTGKIDASGGGGSAFSLGGVGGGGGGSGGGILLEAPVIVLDGAQVVVSAKGGAGASASNGNAMNLGADGGTGPGPAAGGTAVGLPTGGNGGTEAAVPTNGGNGTTSTMDGAGSGGSVGQTRFNTNGAVSPQNGAAIRSRFTTGNLATRRVP